MALTEARNRARRMAMFMNPLGTPQTRQAAIVAAGRLGINLYRNYQRNKKMESFRKVLEKTGQGRVQNWKQIRQTGTGIKIHRRGRRYKRRRRRYLRRKYRRRRFRYFSWLYRNRPPIYKSYITSEFSFGAFNPPIFNPSGSMFIYPAASIFSYTVPYNFPSLVETQKSDYILYKQKWQMFFNFSDGSKNRNDFTHGYVRVLCFRKYGEAITETNLQKYLWSMFKTPSLLTSGYVAGFKRIWCKRFGVQLYSDKLLRISEETNWTTQYTISLYPNIHNRYDSDEDKNHWYYQFFFIGGFGAEDKFDSALLSTSAKEPALNINGQLIRSSYWKYVSGMPLKTNDTTQYLITGAPSSAQGINPRLGGMERVSGAAVVDTVNEPRGETGATGSTSAVSSSFTILHDDQ